MDLMNLVVNLIMGSAACFLAFVGSAFFLTILLGMLTGIVGAAGVAGKRRERRRGREANHQDARKKYLEGPYGAYIEF